MKTQNKLLISLFIAAILLFAGFIFIMQVQKQQNLILENSGIEQQKFILKKAVEAKSEIISLTTYDYTYWDEFLDYLKNPTDEFTESNLNSLFNSFKINYAGIFDLKFQPVFNQFRIDTIVRVPLTPETGVFENLNKSRFIKFYLITGSGLLEVHGATMHSTSDEARKLPPQGYFFMAKLLDSTYLNSLENLTGGKIVLSLVPVDSVKTEGNMITTCYPLKGWDGRTTGWLQLSREYDFLTVSQRLSSISTWFMVVLVLVILVIFFFAFNLWVNIPLKKISQALQTKRIEERRKLQTLKSEFKEIGLLIEDYFEQHEALETEIEVRKKTEAQKEELIKELDAVNHELKDFAYIVSHDLKAPLRAIGSISQWIHADYSDKIDDDGKMQLDLLLSRVHRMQSLIEGVLSYSRVTRVKEEKESIDLNILVKEAIDMVSPPEKFVIQVDENLPTVEFGPTRLLQVFENLISNAVKYNDKEKGIIGISFADSGSAWTFSVYDNGPGIEEKYFEKIFQIFQTLRSRDEYESTGIGLTIVKKIIESNGGVITVKSDPGKGITFTFTILKTLVNSH